MPIQKNRRIGKIVRTAKLDGSRRIARGRPRSDCAVIRCARVDPAALERMREEEMGSGPGFCGNAACGQRLTGERGEDARWGFCWACRTVMEVHDERLCGECLRMTVGGVCVIDDSCNRTRRWDLRRGAEEDGTRPHPGGEVDVADSSAVVAAPVAVDGRRRRRVALSL